MALGTDKLKYLDLTNYLAAGTTLAKFYSAYKVESPKGWFPYEWYNTLKKHSETSLPQRTEKVRALLEKEHRTEEEEELIRQDPYFSILKGKTITNEQVDLCEKEWIEQGMQNFGDFVEFYNNGDVIGLVEGIVKLSKIYKDQKLDMFKQAVSLPKLTQKQIFRALGEDEYFTSFSEKHAYIYKELREGIVGGPSIIFNRYQEKGVTKIRGGELCQGVFGWDCNAMYLRALGLRQCTGGYCLRTKETEFKKHSKNKMEKDYIKYSQKAINWLESIEQERGIKIRHAENHPHGEKRILSTIIPPSHSWWDSHERKHGCFGFCTCIFILGQIGNREVTVCYPKIMSHKQS